jgi:single-strand DNA-binding protein
MGSINRVTIIGNLCAKPELRFLPSGQAVADLRVATNENWTDKDGTKKERAEFHSVTVWGKSAENCARYLDKGRQVCVEGRLQTRDWLDKTHGDKRYKTEIVSTQVTFLGRGENRSEQAEDTTPTENGATSPSTSSTTAPTVDDSDIPF